MRDLIMSAQLATSHASDIAVDEYVTGLKNAHALEKSATQLIERQLERIENYPEVERVLRVHLGETQQQIVRLDELLSSFGTERSVIKDMVTSLTGNLAALGHTVMTDEVLKNHFANHAFENFEIASYLSLITMAEATGHSGHLTALRTTLGEEERTAQTLRDMTGDLTRKYLSRLEQGQKADR